MTDPTKIQREYYAQTAVAYDQMHLMDKEHNLALQYVFDYMTRNQWSSSWTLDVERAAVSNIYWIKELIKRE